MIADIKNNTWRIAWCLFFTFLFSYGQEISYTNYTAEEGLPSSEVYHMFQNSNGHIWFITDRGLAIHDGYDFNKNLINDLLPTSVVLDCRDYGEEVWFYTLSNKLFVYNKRSNQIEPYQYNELVKNAINQNIIVDLYVDTNKTVYISIKGKAGYVSITNEGALSSFKPSKTGNKIKVYNIIDEDNNVFSYLDYDTPIYDEPKFKKNSIEVLITGTNLYKMIPLGEEKYIAHNGKKVFLFEENTLVKELLSDGLIFNIGKFYDNKIWVSCKDKGVKVFDTQGKELAAYLNGKSVTDLLIDHEQGIWFSTLNSGVFYASNLDVKSFVFEEQNNQQVTGIALDGSNNIWLSYKNGNIYKRENNESFVRIYDAPNNSPSYLYYDASKDKMLIHNQGKTFYEGINNQNPLVYASGLTDDSYGRAMVMRNTTLDIIIDTDSLYKVAPAKSKIFDGIDYKKGVLMATLDGLKYYENNDYRDFGTDNPLYSIRINDINKVGDHFFGGSSSSGVVRFNEAHIESYDVSNGLLNNFVSQVYIEDKNTVWACTNSGLNKLSFVGNELKDIKGVSTINGLLSDEVTDFQLVKDSVWVGTKKGVSVFHKNLLDKKENDSLFFQVTQIKVNDSLYDNLDDLDYDENRIQVYFQAISFKNKRKLKYRYKLKGLEKNWNITSNRNLVFASIPPGRYELLIQVSGQNQKWSEKQQLTIPINIKEAFWVTWWFSLLVFIIIASIIYLFFKIRVLSYNEDIIRELLRAFMKKISANEPSLLIKVDGKETRIISADILYIKSSGNYIEIHTKEKMYVYRDNIKHFVEKLPDNLEFIRLHRSYVVRIDKVSQKTSKSVFIDETEIPVGKTYRKETDKIFL